MQFNRDQFMEDGYLVLREVVPPAELDALRTGYEQMVDRQRGIWARERNPRRSTGRRMGDGGTTSIGTASASPVRPDRQEDSEHSGNLASRKHTGCQHPVDGGTGCSYYRNDDDVQPGA